MGYARGKRWTDSIVEEEIIAVVKVLGEDRMPSKSECDSITGNYALTNAIKRYGGFDYFANKLNLKIKESESKLGHKGEVQVKKKLENLGYKVERMRLKHPYDLLVNDNIKIDVKTSSKYKSPEGWNSYSFNLEKENPTCDIYIFLCLEDDKYLIIPSKFLKQTQLTIGEVSKYDKYKDCWGYINQYDRFYKEIV